MKTLLLASAILIGLSASAAAREVFLMCRTNGVPYAHFDIAVDLETSVLTFHHDRDHQATITPDYIEYHSAMVTTRFNRKSGNWQGWTYAGTMNAQGSCQITDDRRRFEDDIIPFVEPRIPFVKPRE